MRYLLEIILCILFVVSLFIDKSLALSLAANRNSFLDSFFAFVINYVIAEIVIAILLVYIIFKKKHLIKPFIAATILSVVSSIAIKVIFNKARPFIILGIEKIPGIAYDFASWNQSFPSWHAVSFFFLIPFVSKKYRVYWLILAIIISLSRIYSNVHYLSDVLFGALLGYMISNVCIKYFSKK